MSTLMRHPPAGPSAARPSIPPLEPGDRLSREEFLRRYEAMPENVKAERIEGIVYMPAAAVSAGFHGVPHAHLMGWLTWYRTFTPGVEVADNSTTLLDLDNDPQPDACLYVLPSHGGRVMLNEKEYIVGAPELIIEVSGSSVSYDLNAKLNAYRRNGVREYLVHRVYDGAFDWFVLREGQYERLALDGQGIFQSREFPGLWLKPDALLAGDLAEVLRTLQSGLASPEHQSFVQRLAK
jgi:Uma2 family endonuclease